MKLIPLSYAVPALLLAGLLIGGCGGSGPANPPVISASRQYTGISFQVSADRTRYSAGQPVALTFTVSNVSQGAITFTFNDAERFDAVVTSSAGTAVWQVSKEFDFGQAFGSTTLAPGQSASYKVAWNQADAGGRQVGAGAYSIRSWFVGYVPSSASLPQSGEQANEYSNPISITVAG
ncbi:MAG TPA: BsuPI-related putative proteinase inhibitor [Chthonomonadales bacterium]|nr:BsuPI-related putative proteinase inhibitor [Chthonomonadales bacterium]